MISRQNNRLDPSMIPPREMKALALAFAKPGHIALIDDAGKRTDIPEPLYRHLTRIVRLMSERQAIVMIPEDETFTTQAAADYLGMSRQHLVDLLEDKRIPFHRVGSHRRVTFKDLLAYEEQRDKERSEALDGLSKKINEAGLYDSGYMGTR